MRKMLLCTLLFSGFMNYCVGQDNSVTEKISVKTFDKKGLAEKFKLEGNEAILFDIPAFIKKNDHLERLVINGSISNDASTTIINFDTNSKQNQDGDYICKEVNTTAKPFLGVKVAGRNDFIGVDVERVVNATSVDIAGITVGESILELNGEVTDSYCDLLAAVRSTEIGDRVEMKLRKGSKLYSKYIVVGSKEINTVTYKYCTEEPIDIIPENNLHVNSEEFSLTTYPNPTASFFNVNFKSASDEEVIFSVMDIAGNLIHKENISNFTGNVTLEHNLKNHSNGTYIVTMQQGEALYKRKVLVVK